MKKKLMTLLLIMLMAFTFAIPAMATEVVVVPVEVTGEQTVTPHTEMTRAYFRTYRGQLQMRIWSMTNGRWLTDWINI